MSWIVNALERIFGGKEATPDKVLIAPAYDEGTIAMSSWIESWEFEGLALYVGNEADHKNAVNFLHGASSTTKLLMFIGHGKATGLMTAPVLGKPHSPISNSEHGCLMDSEDLSSGVEAIHILAWACESGTYFGPGVASLRGSAFLGFKGALNVVINHDESEQQIWSRTVRELLTRVGGRGNIESHDAEWLSSELMTMRKAIKDGRINTGIHNRFNMMFLKAAADNATVYVSQG